jgi:hypothetical protein
MYPAPPATIHPTASPTIILIFFINGEPKISVRIIETKDRNPMPMNSGDPQLKRTTSAQISEALILRKIHTEVGVGREW